MEFMDVEVEMLYDIRIDIANYILKYNKVDISKIETITSEVIIDLLKQAVEKHTNIIHNQFKESLKEIETINQKIQFFQLWKGI